MNLTRYNPVTSTLRHKSLIDKSDLWRGSPIKYLTIGKLRTGGRNNTGRITSFHIGGGHKQLYRKIDFNRKLYNIPCMVVRIEYDPNRTTNIALVCYLNGILSYIISPQSVSPGDILISGVNVEQRIGNSMMIKDILIGTTIYNVELQPGAGAIFSRSAGSSSTLLSKESNGYALIKLSSGEIRLVSILSMATIGQPSNIDFKNIYSGKAGRTRWLGRRPVVRGVAMNPVDHPHGGGEGKTAAGRCSVTPWGKLTKGKKTRLGKYNPLIIKRIN